MEAGLDPGAAGGLVPWPGPEDAAELADGSLVLAATAPRAGVVVIRAIGEIDMLTAPGLRRFLDAAARTAMTDGATRASAPEAGTPVEPGCHGRLVGPTGTAERRGLPRVVCDLSAVTFLSASALAVLIEVAERGVDLRVVAAHGPARRLVDLTGLDHHLIVETRLDRAVAPDLDGSAPGPRAAS